MAQTHGVRRKQKSRSHKTKKRLAIKAAMLKERTSRKKRR